MIKYATVTLYLEGFIVTEDISSARTEDGTLITPALLFERKVTFASMFSKFEPEAICRAVLQAQSVGNDWRIVSIPWSGIVGRWWSEITATILRKDTDRIYWTDLCVEAQLLTEVRSPVAWFFTHTVGYMPTARFARVMYSRSGMDSKVAFMTAFKVDEDMADIYRVFFKKELEKPSFV